ncbi:MAG: ferric reductase-like transmembrane domain-containing protein [Acidimicrobiales bacterium]
MNTEFWWWVARSSGVVAWLAMAATVVWGLLLPAKLSTRQRPAWILDLHRHLGSLTVGATVLHLAALWFDAYVEFTVVDLLVPFAADWKPGPVALGVVAFWSLLVVQISSQFQRRLGRQRWRRLHLLSYLAIVGGTLHGILAGTDATTPTYQLATFAVVGLASFLTIYRVMTRRARGGRAGAARQASAGRSATVATRTASLSSSVTR